MVLIKKAINHKKRETIKYFFTIFSPCFFSARKKENPPIKINNNAEILPS
jgi:hypothetical protein